ncbi:hypothetical protein BHYA_0013g00730 [Botrytis hyacinthi]|uniref:Uncharacterized protein n=1 Tax=Botrytis hyacinthi TaxID=278943 RepID=A0A4Z1H1F3_9HELO|nr:hypothetical protein BHYA_0013g00730 [Botrytis hyacinthi]
MQQKRQKQDEKSREEEVKVDAKIRLGTSLSVCVSNGWTKAWGLSNIKRAQIPTPTPMPENWDLYDAES